MANCMIGFPNRTDASTLSGGAWVATLPLSNLKVRTLGRVARSVDLSLSSTQFDIDLGSSKNIGLVGVVNHNFSFTASYRLRGSNVSDFSTIVFDSGVGFSDVWQIVYPFGTLEWEDDNWWSGKYTPDEIDGYTPTLPIVLPSAKLARYWRLEISDATNPAGYVQLGRLFIGPVWQPEVNMSYGASLGLETDTGVQKARSGAEYFDRRMPYRVQKFSLDWMSQDEAFSRAFEMQRRAGIDQEIFWIHDPDDTTHALRRQFLARLRALSAIEFPYFDINKSGFEVKELI